ncbi:MAG: hypothetical protein JWR18_2492 [Segetibacter sp.]|jgi:uncharacterized membrane protein|nr:hypothetical protein [Segetibacter sp.]
MYQGLLHLHNLGRWVVIILLLVAIVKSLSGMTGNKAFTSGDKKTGLFLMISAHIMLLIGLYQWFAGPGLESIRSMGMKSVMQNGVARFWAIEHAVGMLLGIILITIGRGSAKKNISDKSKHSRSFWYYFIAFIVIVASVPWPFREVARPLIPGMH